LIGNLTRDPEVRFVTNGDAVLNCGLALNKRVKKGDEWVDKATFVDFTIWGPRAEAFARFHHKGSKAALQGHLTMDEWIDNATGQKRSKLKVTVDDWSFVGEKISSTQQSSTAPESSKPVQEEEAF
jgi:single-strand DNA-binding protein